MVGILAFSIILLLTCVLTIGWLNGKLPEFVKKERSKLEVSEGKLLQFSLWGHSLSLRVHRDSWVPLAFMALGPAAILGLSVAYAEILPLRVLFALYVLPAYLIMLFLGLLYPVWGKRALFGFLAGVLATIGYDIARLFLVVALGLPDPIPHIGDLWLGAGTVSHGGLWWVGYLWRFFGNGAGMGIVFAMFPRRLFTVKFGWIYGDLVGLGMFALLFFFPASQLHLFNLNLTVLVNGIIGHWAYGLTLGWLFARSRVVDALYPAEVNPKKPLTWAK